MFCVLRMPVRAEMRTLVLGNVRCMEVRKFRLRTTRVLVLVVSVCLVVLMVFVSLVRPIMMPTAMQICILWLRVRLYSLVSLLGMTLFVW